MKLKYLALTLVVVAVLVAFKARAQEMDTYFIQNTFDCSLRGNTLIKSKDFRPTDTDNFCAAAVKEGEEESVWYVIVYPSRQSEDVLFIIQLRNDVQTIVWSKPSI